MSKKRVEKKVANIKQEIPKINPNLELENLMTVLQDSKAKRDLASESYEKARLQILNIMKSRNMDQHKYGQLSVIHKVINLKEWVLAKLEKALAPAQFETLCPRKPSGSLITAFLNTLPQSQACKIVEECAEIVSQDRIELKEE